MLYLPSRSQYELLNQAAWRATRATRAAGREDVAQSCVSAGYMTEPSPGYFKLTPSGLEARDAYAARSGGWTYPPDRRHPEYTPRRGVHALLRQDKTAMPYYDDDLDEQPRRRPYSEEQARLEDDLADLQARYTETLRRSEVPLYLKTCLDILAAQLNSDPGDPSDYDVLMDTATELQALASSLADIDARMDRVIDQLNNR